MSNITQAILHNHGDLKTYSQKPILTDAETTSIAKEAVKISKIENLTERAQEICKLLYAVTLLTRECNEHRASRGFYSLPLRRLP